MPTNEHNGSLTIAERKRLLIAEGASYRSEIDYSRTIVRGSLNAESIARNALSHLAMGVVAALRGGAALKGGNLRILLPFAVSAISKLSKKSSLAKPLARGVLVLGAVAAITRFVMRKKNANHMTQR